MIASNRNLGYVVQGINIIIIVFLALVISHDYAEKIGMHDWINIWNLTTIVLYDKLKKKSYCRRLKGIFFATSYNIYLGNGE